MTIRNFAFVPAAFTVAPGAKVSVTNRDPVTHTFTSDSGSFTTGDIPPGETRTVTAPTRRGRYPYLCTIHQFMTGVMIVK